jgi:uncharacterized protein with ATP-grasp and redox domains
MNELTKAIDTAKSVIANEIDAGIAMSEEEEDTILKGVLESGLNLRVLQLFAHTLMKAPLIQHRIYGHFDDNSPG